MKTGKKPGKIGFTGYKDAPPDLEKAMDSAILVKDFLPSPEELVRRPVAKQERNAVSKAWKRYCIKNNERGHRRPLAETLKEPTARLDTSIILPRRVFAWLGTKRNKAAFIREVMIKSYEKANR